VFERFTDRARRVLVLAQEEARRMGDTFIGTEHLLLALIGEHEGVAAKVLQQLGLELGKARVAVEALRGEPSEPDAVSPTPPFTARVRKVLELALREALQLGHSYIGTEHMLLGLVREGEGVGSQVLQNVGLDLGQIRKAVIDYMGGVDPTSSASAAPYARAGGGGTSGAVNRRLAERLGASSVTTVNPMKIYLLRMENRRLRDHVARMKKALMVLADGDTPHALALRKAVDALEVEEEEGPPGIEL
jgi:ATP-dependent Clp protease ATP-binding subunit ClpA